MTDKASGRARGGLARAAGMTPDERKAQAVKAAEAKRELASLPKATHTGKLRLIDQEIPCAVLEDGTRVLTQSDFMAAMGMYYSGWIAKNVPIDEDVAVPIEVPHFLAQRTLIPFINKNLGHLQNIVLKYRTEKGAAAHGIRAEIIPSICDVYIDAEKAGKLRTRQKKVAQQAMLLMRALAHVGIVALVDEATGYQRDREKNALAKILEEFVAKELQPYLKTFPADYYEQLFRLYNLPYPPAGNKSWRPAFFGHITNEVVYSRLAPELLPELKKAASKAERKAHLHRWLTSDVGHPKLREHLASIVSILKLSKSPGDFKSNVNIVHPRFGDQKPLDFGDVNVATQ